MHDNIPMINMRILHELTNYSNNKGDIRSCNGEINELSYKSPIPLELRITKPKKRKKTPKPLTLSLANTFLLTPKKRKKTPQTLLMFACVVLPLILPSYLPLSSGP